MSMQTTSRGPGHRRARGLSLIELLVSLAIGMVLMIAIVSAYIGSSGASRVAEAQGRMNEDGQAALAILSQQIRMAHNNPKQPGYAPDTPSNPAFPAGSFAIRGCDGPFTLPSGTATIADLTCTTGPSDSIAVAYEADKYNTVATTGGAATDCLGQALPSISNRTVSRVVTESPFVTATPTVTFTLAENIFYVGTSSTSVTPSLYCRGNGGTTTTGQPLVENVEALQFTYGVSTMTSGTATATIAVKGYLDAAGVAALTATPAPTDADRWAKVLTVRICALVRSEIPVAADTNSAQYVDCNGSPVTAPTDLRLRRAYSTTVVLRNRVPTE